MIPREPSSPRLCYRRLSPDAASSLHDLLVDAHVRPFLFDDRVTTTAACAELLAESEREWTRRGLGLWLLHERDTEPPIGLVGYLRIAGESTCAQLVYALRGTATGRGYAREAAAALIELARARGALQEVRAAVDVDHTPSRRLLEALGFVRDGESEGTRGRRLWYSLPSGRPPLELRSERLLLRPFREDDLGALAALNADPRVMEYFPAPLSQAESSAFLQRIRADMARDGYGVWAVELEGAAPCIGFNGIGYPSFAAPFTPCLEVGWRLLAAHWGRGYATEAARLALRAAFIHLAVPEVVAFTATENRRSRRVMEKLGMRHDAAGDFDHPNVPMGHPLRRHVLYRLAASSWSSGQPSSGAGREDETP